MRNLPVFLAVIFLAVTASFSLWNARADQQEPDTTVVKQNEGESVEIRLARAHLKLAKFDLRRIQEENKKIPNVFTAPFVDNLRLHVVIDEAELEQRLKGKDADAHQIWIRGAEAAVKFAEANLESMQAIHQRKPSSDSARRLERAEVVSEIARLNLERTKYLENSESVLTHLQWQIDELQHQVLELRMRL